MIIKILRLGGETAIKKVQKATGIKAIISLVAFTMIIIGCRYIRKVTG